VPQGTRGSNPLPSVFPLLINHAANRWAAGDADIANISIDRNTGIGVS